eukprot:CAMPEP_0182559046 /NCGR_PEP_ID=MMETSP1324-20130603/2317_1 /TAXON_ID=236786 /ORGANISM="Florenciella sp., Strain RCC1587" /LENGTH=193 /DNA_ID=CAMNT_0024771267 /DNA_START=81 /DNA_END=659 /DNA_ORIENTATION=-
MVLPSSGELHVEEALVQKSRSEAFSQALQLLMDLYRGPGSDLGIELGPEYQGAPLKEAVTTLCPHPANLTTSGGSSTSYPLRDPGRLHPVLDLLLPKIFAVVDNLRPAPPPSPAVTPAGTRTPTPAPSEAGEELASAVERVAEAADEVAAALGDTDGAGDSSSESGSESSSESESESESGGESESESGSGSAE